VTGDADPGQDAAARILDDAGKLRGRAGLSAGTRGGKQHERDAAGEGTQQARNANHQCLLTTGPSALVDGSTIPCSWRLRSLRKNVPRSVFRALRYGCSTSSVCAMPSATC